MTTTETDALPDDVWAELERAGHVPAAPEEALLAARAAVRRAATTQTLRSAVGQARRRRRLRAVLALGVAACLVAAGAVTVRLGDRELSGSAATAATVLERAAHATLAQRDPVVGPGQYLKVRWIQRTWGSASGAGGKTLRGRDGRLATYEEQWIRTIWIPRDVHAAWTFSERTRVLRNGTTDPRFQDQVEPARTWRQPSLATPGTRSYTATYDPDWYASLPRDPAKLLRALRTALGGEGSGADYDFSEIYSEVLRSGLAPARIRSAVFEALAKAPDMVVQRGVRTLDGRAGVAIGARGGTFQMIFDTTTGQYVGERGTDPDFPDVPGMDADKTTLLSAVRTAVVDHAPRPR
jgi:RNA polymerase sigma-70 factor (ECF subfamily)